MAMGAAAYLPVFTIILSEKWAASGHIFMIVAPAIALQTITALRGTVVMAIGRSDITLRLAVENCILWISALLISVSFGIDWVAIAYDIVVILYIPRSIILTLPLIGVPYFTYVRSMLIPIVVTAICVLGYLEINHLAGIGDWGKLFIAAGLSITATAVSAIAQMRPLLADIALMKKSQIQDGLYNPMVQPIIT